MTGVRITRTFERDDQGRTVQPFQVSVELATSDAESVTQALHDMHAAAQIVSIPRCAWCCYPADAVNPEKSGHYSDCPKG